MAKEPNSKIDEFLKRGSQVKIDNQKIEKSLVTIPKIDRRKFNHGTPQSGRKPKLVNLIERGTKQLFDEYADEMVDLKTTTKDGKVITIQKPRKLVMLQKLWEIAMTMNSHEAAEKWLNRIMGKPAQPIVGDDDHDPIKIEHDITSILQKGYDDND